MMGNVHFTWSIIKLLMDLSELSESGNIALLNQDVSCKISKSISLNSFCVGREIQHLGQMRFYVSKEFIKFNYDTYNYQKQSTVW